MASSSTTTTRPTKRSTTTSSSSSFTAAAVRTLRNITASSSSSSSHSLHSPLPHSNTPPSNTFWTARAHAKIFRREYNIVVLGAGGVGKSCLTAQFVQNVWIESYDPTIEDSYRKVVEVDGKSCVLEILDTAGTEQFTSMREIYLKSGQGFLLVYSITSLTSFQELTPIRDAILRIKEVEDVPLVIVGNKLDLEGDRQVSKNRANHLARKWGNVPTYESSARRRQNVDEVFLNLTRQLVKMYAGDQVTGNPAMTGGGVTPRGRRRGRSCVIL